MPIGEAMKKENGIHELVEQNVWNLIFDQPFDEVKFRKLNSDFNTLIEKFLIQKEFEEDPHIANYYKINAFKKRNATKLYDSLINDIDVSRRTDPNRNAQYFLNQYNIEKGIFGLIPEDERKMDFKSGNYGLDIDKISENLDIYFISEKLKYYTEILSWNQLYHTNLNIRGIEIVMKLANNPLFKEIPVIAVFSKIIQIKLEPENEEHYFDGVREDVWNFHIGGYQVCAKWLKDRRERELSAEDIVHYGKVVSALGETIRLMAEVDGVIESAGGWAVK